MSLLTTPVLHVLYNESQGDDIEYRAKNFWENFLIQQFPQSSHYSVKSEVSPDGISMTRLDLSVSQVRGQYPYQSHPTLMFQEVKRKGTGELKEVEGQLRRGAKAYLEKSGQSLVYGMTGWGTKARAWIIERSNSGHCRMKPYFGKNIDADRASYIDANDDRAYYISLFMSLIRGDVTPPPMPVSLQQAATMSQGGY